MARSQHGETPVNPVTRIDHRYRWRDAPPPAPQARLSPDVALPLMRRLNRLAKHMRAYEHELRLDNARLRAENKRLRLALEALEDRHAV